MEFKTYCGLDIHKDKYIACLLNKEGEELSNGYFQARRGNIKFEHDGNREFVNTTYTTGCIPNRVLIAILNNYQQKDGTIKIPKVLVPYMRGINKLK